MLQSHKAFCIFDLIIFLFSIECNRSTHYKHYVVLENEKLSYDNDHFYSLQTNYFIYFKWKRIYSNKMHFIVSAGEYKAIISIKSHRAIIQMH